MIVKTGLNKKIAYLNSMTVQKAKETQLSKWKIDLPAGHWIVF